MPRRIEYQIDWPSPEMREEYQNWRRETWPKIKCLFTPQELAIFYLHYGLGWGWRKINLHAGFSRYTYNVVVTKFKEYAYHASTSYESEITLKSLYANDEFKSTEK